MIWLALLIPLIAVICLGYKFHKKMQLIEYALVFLVPIICIFIGKGCSIHNQVVDTEYWNSYGVTAIYEEEWSERWTELETYTTTDSKGNMQVHTRMVTRRRNHPEQWTLTDNINNRFNISKKYFESLCKLWDNRTFKDMRREQSTSHTITKDGNAYVTVYDGVTFDSLIPLCVEHTYENRVQCSKSVFNFETVSQETKQQYGLFEYPKENVFGYTPILGCTNKESIDILRKYNALNGAKHQIHMMLVVFKDQPLETGLFQESYWKGGNKNEFIVCVGLKDNDIKWTRVISWTENETLKVKTAREIKEMKTFDVMTVVNYMGTNIPSSFVRKEFKDFSYISVQPSTTAIILTYILTLLVTIGIAIFSINNDY